MCAGGRVCASGMAWSRCSSICLLHGPWGTCCGWMQATITGYPILASDASCCGLQRPDHTSPSTFRATTSAPLPISPSENETAGAALQFPWCTLPSSLTCVRLHPGTWPFTHHTQTTPGLLTTSLSLPSPVNRQVSEAGRWMVVWAPH